MSRELTHTTLGSTGLRVHRLGLSASYRPGKSSIYAALEHGVNYLFCFGFDGQMTAVLRDVLKSKRESYVVATGAYNLVLGHPNLERLEAASTPAFDRKDRYQTPKSYLFCLSAGSTPVPML
jgi:hypothetical protein